MNIFRNSVMEIVRNALMAMPKEIKQEIINYLGTDALLALSGTCKELNEMCTHPDLWAQRKVGANYAWGLDSSKLLKMLDLERFSRLEKLEISSWLGQRKPPCCWNEMLTCVMTLPKLLALHIEADVSNVAPHILGDMVEVIHCVTLNLMNTLSVHQKVAIMKRLASTKCVTRHLSIYATNLHDLWHRNLCQLQIMTMRLLWSIDFSEGCMSEKQNIMFTELTRQGKLRCIRKDLNNEGLQECRYHTRNRLARQARVEEVKKTEAVALLNE